MAGSTSVTVKFDEGLNRLFSSNELLREAIRRGLEQGAIEGETLVKARAPVKTGALRRSFSYEMDKSGLGYKLGSNIKYAGFRDTGGEILPRKKKYLAWALPGNPTITDAGVAGVGAGQFKRKGQKQYGMKTFIVPAKSGEGRLVVLTTIKPPKYKQLNGVRFLVEKGVYLPLYILAPSVTQEGSFYWTETIDNPRYSKFVIDQVDAQLKLLFGTLSIARGSRA